MLVKCPKCTSDAWRQIHSSQGPVCIECLCCGHMAEGKDVKTARYNWYNMPSGVVYILAASFRDAKRHAEEELHLLPGDYQYIERASQIPTIGGPIYSIDFTAEQRKEYKVFLNKLKKASGTVFLEQEEFLIEMGA